MAIYFGGKSAQEFWRGHSRGSINKSQVITVKELESCNATNLELEQQAPWKVGIQTAPFEILVDDRNRRNTTKFIRPRLWVWGGSFAKISDGEFVFMPEDLALHLAENNTLPQLLIYYSELLGTFALGETADETQYGRRPLTSVDLLQKKLDESGAFHGKRRAKKALELVIPNAASPAEEILALMLSAPQELGGFGLPRPELNPQNVFTTLNGKCYVPDLWWRKAKLDVEYFGSDHLPPEKMVRDSLRRNDIVSTGATFYVATKRHLYTMRLLEELASGVAKALGEKPVDTRDEARSKRWEFQRQLLSALPPVRSASEIEGRKRS